MQATDDVILVALDDVGDVLTAARQMDEQRSMWTDVTRIDRDGGPRWSHRIEGLAYIRSIAVGPDGDAFVGGARSGVIRYEGVRFDAGSGAVFVMKIRR